MDANTVLLLSAVVVLITSIVGLFKELVKKEEVKPAQGAGKISRVWSTSLWAAAFCLSLGFAITIIFVNRAPYVSWYCQITAFDAKTGKYDFTQAQTITRPESLMPDLSIDKHFGPHDGHVGNGTVVDGFWVNNIKDADNSDYFPGLLTYYFKNNLPGGGQFLMSFSARGSPLQAEKTDPCPSRTEFRYHSLGERKSLFVLDFRPLAKSGSCAALFTPDGNPHLHWVRASEKKPDYSDESCRKNEELMTTVENTGRCLWFSNQPDSSREDIAVINWQTP